MAGSALLDTNIVVAGINGDRAVAGRALVEGLYPSAIVVGELRFGALKSARVDENLARIARFLAGVPVLAVDEETGVIYGRIRNEHGTLISRREISNVMLGFMERILRHTKTPPSNDPG